MPATAWISCNACGADAFVPLATVDEWQIGQCSNCSLTYVNPVPLFQPTAEFSEKSLEFQYTRYMYQEITPEILQFEREQLRGQLATLSRHHGNGFQPRRFLDVGCGSGASVRAAVDIGLEATGVDLDPKLIELGKTQLNVDLRNTDLLGAGLEHGRFHFIRLRDVIEHLPNPYEVLLEVQRLLVPGGVALIITPNEDSLPNRARQLVGWRKRPVAAVPPPHHLHGFIPKTLRQLFERIDFHIDEIYTTTPVDPTCVTSNNMRNANRTAYVAVWRAGKAIGKGSMLVGWVRKKDGVRPKGNTE